MGLLKIFAALSLVAILGTAGFLLSRDFAPDVTFINLQGRTIALKSLQGHPVLVTFWASDCKSCIKEIPDLVALYRQYQPLGLEIIAVAMAYDPPSHVVAISETLHLPYPVALDLKSEHALAFGDVNLTPTTFLINPKGRIVKKIIGLFDVADLKSAIDLLIKE